MNLLVITDSNTHGLRESVYSVLPELAKHCRLSILDRNLESNKRFFAESPCPSFQCYELSPDAPYDFESYKKNRCDTSKRRIDEFDGVFMRIDRPISEQYLRKLEAFLSKQVVVNPIHSVLKTYTKRFLLELRDVCPPMQLCHSVDEALDFASQRETVLKPLNSYGGKGLYRIGNGNVLKGDQSISVEQMRSELDVFFEKNDEYLAMAYLPRVSEGDKRVIVVDGEIVGTFRRVPSDNSWIANISHGGYAEGDVVTERTRFLTERVLQQIQGLDLCVLGLDILKGDDGVEFISEINTLNPGGMWEASHYSCDDAIRGTARNVLHYIEQRV